MTGPLQRPLELAVFRLNHLERATRIELAFSAWEADVLPLNYAREGTMVLHCWFARGVT